LINSNIKQNTLNKNYWGKFKDSQPEMRFDPLQSFIEGENIFGFRILISSSRTARPREYKRSRKESQINDDKDSILLDVITGKELAIVIDGDGETIGLPSDDASYHRLENYYGVTIVNKYPPLSQTIGKGRREDGIALVAFPTRYTDSLNDSEAIYFMLRSMFSAIRKLTDDNLKSSVVFMNIGKSSGASLRHLHAQAYMTQDLHGLLSYGYIRAFDSHDECFTCKMANQNGIINDHLEQNIDLDKLTIWEDDHIRLIQPFAPIRILSLRILPKQHINRVEKMSDDTIKSLGQAMSIAHQVIATADIPWPNLKDHSIAFRQRNKSDDDFHMIIDMMSTIPLGGSETVDFLSISTVDPYDLAKKFRDSLETNAC
jgi:galactose-1-phosphate uridylyltransferase